MAYRISLHILATLWHLMLMVLAIGLRKKHRYYASFVPVCLFSALFTLSWALGLIYQSELAMRLTWVGFFWSTYYYFFVCEIFNINLSPWLRRLMWWLSFFIVFGGISPWGLVRIISYEPDVVALYGKLEPALRWGSLIQLLLIIWTLLRVFFSPLPASQHQIWSTRVGIFGFLVYGIGAAFSCCLLPLFGEYRYVESTSYGSVVWTSYALWIVFRELQTQNKMLEELDVFKKTLINHVTHEFRTPLGAITSAVDVLTHTPADQQKTKSEYLGMIEQNAERLTHFVNELLDLAAIQQARVKLLKSTVDVAELIGNVITQLQPLAQKQKTILAFEGGSVLCECDADKIEQVVSNLISNAIKATPQGRIQIQLTDQGKAAMVSVSDNGVGLSAEHLPHIFSSFYQVQLRAPQHKGSGLGLAIAKGWVESHGGTLHAESSGEGQGSRFWFTIPK